MTDAGDQAFQKIMQAAINAMAALPREQQPRKLIVEIKMNGDPPTECHPPGRKRKEIK